MTGAHDDSAKVRLDKWLWAARLYKTRSLAKEAIEGGKVTYNGQRCKSGRGVEVGARLTVRQGWADKEVMVTGLSDRRGNAQAAALLYQETEASMAAREQQAMERRTMAAAAFPPARRPTKKQRRQIHRFKQADSEPR